MMTLGQQKPTLSFDSIGDIMENTNTPIEYPFIRSYKQRAEELLTIGRSYNSLEGISILIEKEDEYVCEAYPSFNIKKGSPFTELFLAVYDWTLLNYKREGVDLEDIFDSFSYILLDSNNYKFMPKGEFQWFDFEYRNIKYHFGYHHIDTGKIPNYKSDKTFKSFTKLFPMKVLNRKLTGLKEPYNNVFKHIGNETISPDSFTLEYDREEYGSLELDEVVPPLPEIAPNFFEFVTNEKFLNSTIFPRQLQYGINLFEDYCPYCSDTDFAQHELFDQTNEEIQERITFYEFDKCPKCGKTKKDALDSGYFKNVNTISLSIGMRGGKSVFTAYAALYQLHKYLGMRQSSLDHLYQQIPSYNNLHIVFVSHTVEAVYNSIWYYFIQAYKDSPWFTQHFNYSNNNDVILNDTLKNTYLKFSEKNIIVECVPPNIKIIRGETNIFVGMSDVNWWDVAQKGREFAHPVKAVYQALEKSLRTIRGAHVRKGIYNIPTAIMCVESSAHLEDDNELMHQLKKDSLVLSYNHATWETNPHVSIKDCLKETDPAKHFLRDFAGTPVVTVPEDRVNNWFIGDYPNISSIDSFRAYLRDFAYTGKKNEEDYVDIMLTLYHFLNKFNLGDSSFSIEKFKNIFYSKWEKLEYNKELVELVNQVKGIREHLDSGGPITEEELEKIGKMFKDADKNPKKFICIKRNTQQESITLIKKLCAEGIKRLHHYTPTKSKENNIPEEKEDEKLTAGVNFLDAEGNVTKKSLKREGFKLVKRLVINSLHSSTVYSDVYAVLYFDSSKSNSQHTFLIYSYPKTFKEPAVVSIIPFKEGVSLAKNHNLTILP